MQERIELIGQMATVALTPDAILVLQVPGRISDEIANRLKRDFEERFPGHKCLVLSDGITAGVLQPTTVDRLESIEATLASMASTLLALADALTDPEEQLEDAPRPGLDGDPPARERDQSQPL